MKIGNTNWKTKTVRITNGRIRLHVECKVYYYTVDDYALLNSPPISIGFNLDNPSVVYLYSSDGENYLGKATLNNPHYRNKNKTI
jgi:hypothetical protein